MSAMSLLLSNCSTYYSEHYKGAVAGNADDQYAIATCYDDGDGGVPGGKVDKAKAASWYLKAANQGHSGAQNNLGVLYARGEGVPHSKAMAAGWYEKAAMQGNKYAQYNLGGMYYDLQCSYDEDSEAHRFTANALKNAAHYYAMAAAQGHSDAQYKLARCYDYAAYNNFRRKSGVFFDLGGDYKNAKAYWAQADKWYREAAKSGNAKYQEDYNTFRKFGSAHMASCNVGPEYLNAISS